MSDEVNLNNSVPINLNLWSDHEGFERLATEIYDAHFSKARRIPALCNIKVLLVNLFRQWKLDQPSCLSVGMSRADYRTRTRYNATSSSSMMIPIMNELRDSDWINIRQGFYDRRTKIGRKTRIWPNNLLLDWFNNLDCSLEDIFTHVNAETIILRDDEKNDVEYEDTPETIQMRNLLTSYNDLLRRTFIDIPDLEDPVIIRNEQKVSISQSNKFVRRIFNNSSWANGGRFYGGWWQRISSEDRQRIYLNDERTIEDDYSGIHIVLLYAEEGVDYWKEINEDPYHIEVPSIDNPDITRKLSKLFLLVALNAANEESAIRATINQTTPNREENNPGLGVTVTRKMLIEVLEALRAKHPQIAHKLCSNAGIELMRLDSELTNVILGRFIKEDIPILSIHDSYIVPANASELLKETMKEAFIEVTGQENVQIKRDGLGQERVKEILINARRWEHLAPDYFNQELIEVSRQHIPRTEGYIMRRNKFLHN